MSIKNITFVITGASRGLGKAISLKFAEEGAKLILTHYSDHDEMASTLQQIQKIGAIANATEADFSTTLGVTSFADEVFKSGNNISGLINNAGIINRSDFFNIGADDLASMFQVNSISPLILSQKYANSLIRENKHGSIINISSIAGSATFQTSIGYSASKAALNKWTENAALNLAPFKIRCNAISPGVTSEGMNSNLMSENPAHWEYITSQIPLQKCGTGKDIAEMVLFLASEKSSWITGKIFEVDGGHALSK